MVNNMTTLKYWSWLGVFSVSTLFWCQLIWLAFV
nr:small membrane protein YmiC [Enterobacter sp. RIT 418]